MAGVPTKHHSKSKVGRRRSHLALTTQQLVVCKECGAAMRPHRYCANCGHYKGKEITSRITKFVEKKK
ncbi:MAG: 50S ribosomal protein L32 [Patescibacteria group bacterium]|nr:50S ribosomal protein L32 [Patescibacteria group bacterium]MDE2438061.1 50S ribosomal protein L32 [Patescibacteria group bacterium]